MARKTLRLGSKGADVSYLQRRLVVTVDGDFGPITDAAVRKYQGKKGLVIDGIVGPATWGALGTASKPASNKAKPSLALRHPLAERYRQDNDISASFRDHQTRTPPSVNPGTDYMCGTGTAVYAAHSATVILADSVDNSATGRWVILRGGNLETQYLHLSKLAVKQGQFVARNSLIGLSGATGNVTGPHLHFTLLINGKRVDPEDYI